MDAVIEVTNADKGFLLLIEDGDPRVAVARNLNQREPAQRRAPSFRQHRRSA